MPVTQAENMKMRYLRRIALELTQVPICNSEYVAEFKVRSIIDIKI